MRWWGLLSHSASSVDHFLDFAESSFFCICWASNESQSEETQRSSLHLSHTCTLMHAHTRACTSGLKVEGERRLTEPCCSTEMSFRISVISAAGCRRGRSLIRGCSTLTFVWMGLFALSSPDLLQHLRAPSPTQQRPGWFHVSRTEPASVRLHAVGYVGEGGHAEQTNKVNLPTNGTLALTRTQVHALGGFDVVELLLVLVLAGWLWLGWAGGGRTFPEETEIRLWTSQELPVCEVTEETRQ